MHSYAGGIGKQVTECYVNNFMNEVDLKECDERLLQTTYPRQIHRLTKIFSSRGDWNTRDWENFMLFGSIPTFKPILESKFFEQWRNLVESLYVLLKSKVTREEVLKARTKLKKFGLHVRKEFGLTECTYNLHIVTDHIAQSVLDYGPLWGHNCYSVESENGNLLRSINNANGVPQQIVRYVNWSKKH